MQAQEVGGTLIGEDGLIVMAATINGMVSYSSNTWFLCV
jgi:proteasome assembly chaperone (PAC2) family protein